MLTRQDSMRAKEGMERYKSPDMQLRVSEIYPIDVRPYFLASTNSNTDYHSIRLVGALVSDHAIAAITSPA